MLTETSSKARGLDDLPPVVNDSLLALIALCDADPRPEKIDVGVGVFRDGAGNTPILKVMKEAEQRLLDTQLTKAYLGSAGDKRFAELLRPILLGHHADDERIAGVQTPGGCGALRLGDFARGELARAEAVAQFGDGFGREVAHSITFGTAKKPCWASGALASTASRQPPSSTMSSRRRSFWSITAVSGSTPSVSTSPSCSTPS